MIIGGGGSSIRRLRSESGAYVRMDTDCLSGCQDRLMSVSGVRKQILECVRGLLVIIEEQAGLQRGEGVRFCPVKGGGSDLSPVTGVPSPMAVMLAGLPISAVYEGSDNCLLVVPTAVVGKVFGLGGEKISQIRKLSKAMVEMECGEVDTQVKIVGSACGVAVARSLIQKIVEDCSYSPMFQSGDRLGTMECDGELCETDRIAITATVARRASFDME